MNKFLITLFLVLNLLATPIVQADQRDSRLDTLFFKLNIITDLRQAQFLSGEIWRIWSAHDSSEVNELYRKGEVALLKGDYESGLTYFNQVIELAPNFAEGWNKRATIFYLMGDYQSSLLDIEETLKLEPRHFGALSGKGMCYWELQKLDPALNAFEKALEVNPWLINAYRNVEMIKRIINQQA